MSITTCRLIAVAALLGLAGPASAEDPAPTATPAATADAEKLICRKTAEVGSLVRKKKECYTKAEWDRLAESQQRGTRRMQDELMGGMRCDPAVQQC